MFHFRGSSFRTGVSSAHDWSSSCDSIRTWQFRVSKSKSRTRRDPTSLFVYLVSRKCWLTHLIIHVEFQTISFQVDFIETLYLTDECLPDALLICAQFHTRATEPKALNQQFKSDTRFPTTYLPLFNVICLIKSQKLHIIPDILCGFPLIHDLYLTLDTS